MASSENDDSSRVMGKATVSAVSTTYNCLAGLRECLLVVHDAVARGLLTEIVICDGGSTDGTWEMLVNLSNSLSHLIVFQVARANISEGRNLAIRRAQGDILFVFDSGCRMGESYVSEMLKPFDQDEVDVVGGETVFVGETPFERVLAQIYSGTRQNETNPSSRTIAFRREVFDVVGGYDESVAAGEDTHFNQKWRAAGFGYRHASEARVFWRVRPNLTALFKMAHRNARGCTALGNRWGMKTRLARMAPLVLCAACITTLLGLAGVKCAGWFGLVLGCVWLVYVCGRLLSRRRWRYFINPANFLRGVWILTVFDTGTLFGTLHAIKERHSTAHNE